MNHLYDVCVVFGAVALGSTAVYLGIVSSIVGKCYVELRNLNKNLSEINKSLRKIAEGGLEKDIEQDSKQ